MPEPGETITQILAGLASAAALANSLIDRLKNKPGKDPETEATLLRLAENQMKILGLIDRVVNEAVGPTIDTLSRLSGVTRNAAELLTKHQQGQDERLKRLEAGHVKPAGG